LGPGSSVESQQQCGAPGESAQRPSSRALSCPEPLAPPAQLAGTL
ncbi:uncharacterized, partial [Tachysurus ichikawai]